MDNNQTIQHELTQEEKPKAKLKNSKSIVISSYRIFIYLLTRHPLLLLTGLFATMLGSAGFALYNLTYVSDVEKVEPEPVPSVIEEPIAINSESANPLPLWMVAAIALSCASGCWVIFRLLNQPKQGSQAQKPHATKKAASIRPNQPQQQLQTSKHQPVFRTVQPLPAITPVQTIKKPLITSIPPEQRNLFEESRESLAELLDWRKHNSLTAILQQYSS